MPHLVTAHKGEPHVSSANAAHYNAGTLGPGRYVLPVLNRMACTMVDSNTLRILPGAASCCGREWEVVGDYEEVTIGNGTPGYKRVVIVAARLTTDPEGIDWVVLDGDEATAEPVPPSIIDGDLNDGDTVCDHPVCSVLIDGINPQEPVSLLEESVTIQSLAARLEAAEETLSQSFGSGDGWRWYRYGKVVTVTGHCETTAAETVELGTIPLGSRPPGYIAAPCISQYNNYAEVRSSGVVSVVAKGAGSNYFSLSYTT